jgi:hypothetical protein
MHNIFRIAVRCSALIFFVIQIAFSWGGTAHRLINLKAVMHLPSSMNALKADSAFYQAHASDPDYRKDYSDTSFFSEAERHYIDIDIYPFYHNIPHDLDSMTTIYGRDYTRSNGTLPWATKMVLDSLTAQFVQGNSAKIETTMSDLGHYVGDAFQPLHCTQNYNPDGLHSRYETQLINRYVSSLRIIQDSVQYIASPLDYIFACIYQSNELVSTLIAADVSAKTASGWNGSGTVPETYYDSLWIRVQDFTKAQIQNATVSLASLWYTAWFNAQVTLAVRETQLHLPENFTLHQNYPNPFNPSTRIPVMVSRTEFISLKVYDVTGKQIAVLIDEIKLPGTYEVEWNAAGFSSGAYYYRMQSGTAIEIRKMILMK